MTNYEDNPEDVVAYVESLRGPGGWINWQAERLGMPRRTTHHPRSLLLRPIWEEFALYSDTELETGGIAVGPYEFLISNANVIPTIGQATRTIVLRAWDHIFDEPEHAAGPGNDLTHYHGGDVGNEMAALLGLALGRRVRSGGSTRAATPLESPPIGEPCELYLEARRLEPPRDWPMIPAIVEPASLEQIRPLLEAYPTIESGDAVALVRSARQFVDGLWLADADPRLAWIRMVGALEAAANRRDDSRYEDPVAQLKRHKPDLYRLLQPEPPEVLEAIAGEVSRLYWQSTKVWSLVKAFDPGPPAERPEYLRFDWSELEAAIFTIYDHRSRDLHDGMPWPWPLCEPPGPGAGVPSEGAARGAEYTGWGARWTGDSLPMYFHVFAHLVGGTLRNWWASLDRSDHSPASIS
jgi:hypothetical protein